MKGKGKTKQISCFFQSLNKLISRRTTMANLDIFNLEPAGSELFADNENFLADLNDSESGDVAGGYWWGGYYNYNYQQSVQTNVTNTVNGNTIGNNVTVKQ
jgi:hypothetical protein